MQHKHFRGHASIKDATQGLAEVVVSAYGNVDHDGDIVLKGASAKQIAGDYGPNPKGLLDHDWSMRSAVAKTLSWWEEDDGLHIEAQYNLEKEAGRDAFSDLLFYGDDMEFSVGYAVKSADRPDPEDKALGARRIIKEWQINEWSHVMLGANSDTHLVGAKAGARNSATDGERLQTIHDLSVENGAKCDAVDSEDEKGRKAVKAEKSLVGSYEYLSEQLCQALQIAFPSEWLWVRGTMPDSVVFVREVDTFDGYLYGTFQVGYVIADDGEVTFDGDPVEVNIAEIVEPKGLANDEAGASPVPAAPVLSDRERRHRLLVVTAPS